MFVPPQRLILTSLEHQSTIHQRLFYLPATKCTEILKIMKLGAPILPPPKYKYQKYNLGHHYVLL